MSIPDVLQRITSALEHAGIPYMLTGSLASAHHGTPRSTRDINLVIETSPAQVRALLQTLEADGYYAELNAALEAQRRASLFNVIDCKTGWKIDFIFRKSRPFSREEFGRRQLVEVEGVGLYVATAEDVIISKLEWAKMGQSHRQIEDVTPIVQLKRQELDESYLKRWISELDLNEQWAVARCGTGLE